MCNKFMLSCMQIEWNLAPTSTPTLPFLYKFGIWVRMDYFFFFFFFVPSRSQLATPSKIMPIERSTCHPLQTPFTFPNIEICLFIVTEVEAVELLPTWETRWKSSDEDKFPSWIFMLNKLYYNDFIALSPTSSVVTTVTYKST